MGHAFYCIDWQQIIKKCLKLTLVKGIINVTYINLFIKYKIKVFKQMIRLSVGIT